MNEITNQEFDMLRAYIKDNFGISLSDEKKSLIYSRLRTILQEKNIPNFTEYYKFLTNDKSGDAVVNFIDRITTNHTYFMRETDHFDYFKEFVLPYLETTYKSTRDIRLWCAGCSSGEEPYTLQMILQDYFKQKPEKWDLQILATDISSTVLNKCVNGIYHRDSVKTLPQNWINDYFDKKNNDNYEVKASIKKNVIFRKLNLMDRQFPFKKPFQVIFCRNVMIYFDAETRNELVDKFYNITLSGGYLFIGHSESLNHTGTAYKYTKPAIYRKE